MTIDKTSQTPVYIQIYNNIADGIRSGYLAAGERLPSRRALSKELGVAQRTVENAYMKLLSDEFITSKTGSGYYVSSDREWDAREKVLKSRIFNFSTNGVETSKLPFAEWSRLMRSTAREDKGLFQHGEKSGERCLRRSIRRMLYKTQGIRCTTDQIVIGPGAEDLLRDIFLLLGFGSSVVLNNYYFYRVNEIASKQLHMDIKYVLNGPEGIDTDELMTIEKGILFQKPTHDLPTAVTLSEEKRRQIVNWAQGEKYVIEDGTENGYCYGKPPKTLWELSGGRNVIYLGSFSKTIAPSMKIGYVILPEDILIRWFKEKRFYSNRVSRVEQVTLSKFIDAGHFDRHVQYMRSVYHAKTEAFRKAVESSPLSKKCRISGCDAGMYCIMECDIDMEEKAANRLLRENGVKLSPLRASMYDEAKALYAPNTYVVGYGEMTISQIREGVAKWAAVWKELLR